MLFCSHCGAGIQYRIPPGDNRERAVCHACGTIHYQNPKIVAGTLCLYQDQILLCKRAIEPRYGLWTLPAGFMEMAESVEEAALRETWEEALAKPALRHLYSLISLPHIGQVYMLYLAELQKPEFGPGAESLKVALFEPKDIPWDRLAFKTVRHTLEWYLMDRQANAGFPLHTAVLGPR